MATTLSALLNIKANVQGEGAVGALGRSIGGLQSKAAAAAGGLKALTGAAGMGGLAGAMGTLTPLLSAAGLSAMAGSAINAADNMNDLAQKTGASVENLSKFQQAANAGGTNIDAVGKALVKLNRGLSQLATEGKGPAKDALLALGISATDARGKMLSADEIMLRVADKFKSMPDGAAKTAAAMNLFGKAGADMIPMLNGGRAAIEGLSATMTTKFAKGADELNDKMAALQAKLMAVGVEIGTALMPLLNTLTDAVTALANAFGALPGPLQSLIGGIALLAIGWAALAPAISATISVFSALGLSLGGISGVLATIAGWLPVVTGFFSGLATVLAGLITWPVVLVAALVAAGVAIFVFRDQIAAFFKGAVEMLMGVIDTVWQMGEPIRQFWADLWGSLMDLTAPFFEWITEAFGATFASLIELLYQVFINPYVEAWKGLQLVAASLLTWLQNAWASFGKWIGGIFTAIGDTFRKFVVDPLTKAWRFIIDTGKAALRGLLGFAVDIVNGVIKVINGLIDALNRVRSAVGRSTLNKLGLLSVPKFAEGGFVTGPTLAMVGDNPGGREYVIPEGKAAGFAANYMAGARGAAAIPTTSGGASTAGGAAGPVTVNLSTGPIMQTADGQRSVSLEEVERLVRDGVSQTIRQLRTPAGRYATGVR
jgi:hypothetical protein